MLSYKFTRTASSALLAALMAAATLFATKSVMAAEPTTNANATCHAQLASVRTAFPQDLQSRGDHGVVKLNVAIDKNGRAAGTQVAISSGYPALDRAAADSVQHAWRFDVSACAPGEQPADAFVTVKFERAPHITVSGTRNRHQRQLTANTDTASRCDVVRDPTGDAVVACVTGVALANRTNAQTVARVDAKK